MEEGRRGRAEGPAEDGHRAASADPRRRDGRKELPRGHQGHRPQDRPGRHHPGQQAGREDHPPGRRDRQGPGRDAAHAGGHPGRLVLAVLPAQPLAVHAAHARPGHPVLRVRARISPPGTCRGSSPRSTSTFKRPWPPRSNSKRSPSRASTNCSTKAPCPTATGPRSTTSWPTRPWSSTTPASRRRPRRKTPSTFRPTAPFSARSRSSLPGRSRARIRDSITLKAIRLYQQLLSFHQNDERQVGPAGRRHRTAELRQQQGRGRGEGDALQGGLAAFREAMGRPSDLGHRPLPLGRGLAARRLAGRGPRPGRSRAPRPLPTRRAAISATTS